MTSRISEELLITPYRMPQCGQRRFLGCLCLVLALLQIFDLHSSLRAAGSGRTETNPVILWAIPHVGLTPALLAFKAAALAAIGGYYVVASSFKRMLWPSISLMPVCVMYIAIVLNNYS